MTVWARRLGHTRPNTMHITSSCTLSSTKMKAHTRITRGEMLLASSCCKEEVAAESKGLSSSVRGAVCCSVLPSVERPACAKQSILHDDNPRQHDGNARQRILRVMPCTKVAHARMLPIIVRISKPKTMEDTRFAMSSCCVIFICSFKYPLPWSLK